MSKVVICGGGPIGLYLAIRLKQMGVKNIVVYDPRTGDYTRPGHLNTSVFFTAERGLKMSFWDYSKIGHIKDLEKKLYKEAVKLNIDIEKKSFIGFINTPGKKGIVVKDLDGVQTEVECNIAFDCTGSRRDVVNAINLLQPDSFTLKPIIQDTDIFIKRHFIAYVKMKPLHYVSLKSSSYPFYSAEKYVQYMEKFREMGWKEFTHPYFYEAAFRNNKYCMYIEHPDSLAPELHEQWVQTVLEFHSDDPTITYEHCLPKGGKKKPRFQAFTVDPQMLSPLSFPGSKQLPMVIAQGDVQIDFNHRLAHGMEDGFERVETFLKDLDIIDGLIYFDGDTFAYRVKPELRTHQDKLIRHYTRQKENVREMLQTASLYYTKAVQAAVKDSEGYIKLHSTLLIIEARIAHQSAVDGLNTCSKRTKLEAGDLVFLDKIQSDIAHATQHLTEQYELLRSQLTEMSSKLALHYRTVGNDLFQKKRYEEAVETYKKSLKLATPDSLNLDKLTLISNLILCYRNLGEPRDSFELLIIALSDAQHVDVDMEIKIEKIIYNFVHCVAEGLPKEEKFSDNLLAAMQQIKERMSEKTKQSLKAPLDKIAQHGYNVFEKSSLPLLKSSKSLHFFKEPVLAGTSADGDSLGKGNRSQDSTYDSPMFSGFGQ